ncbi:MAG: hypothetical protein LBE04_00090 [Prevotellaceae bacterium]|jgi:hypothetical protein|nr:hypothetical protein [Prevotellaceae bacterium]
MKIFKQILATVADNDDNIIIFVRKHYKYLILIFILIILYISNGLIYELEVKQQNRLEERLLRSKIRYNLKLKEFTEFYNYRNLINLSNKYDLKLEESTNPPIKVEK